MKRNSRRDEQDAVRPNRKIRLFDCLNQAQLKHRRVGIHTRVRWVSFDYSRIFFSRHSTPYYPFMHTTHNSVAGIYDTCSILYASYIHFWRLGQNISRAHMYACDYAYVCVYKCMLCVLCMIYYSMHTHTHSEWDRHFHKRLQINDLYEFYPNALLSP